MTKYNYVRANTLDEAIGLLNGPNTTGRPLAGGTDLMVAVRQQTPNFDRLIDISRLPELSVIRQTESAIEVGAGVTFTRAVRSELLNRVAPLLVEACQTVGSPQIRNRGTLGGNVANAAACADSLPVLVCLDAVAHLKSVSGERQLPVTEFVTGPNRTAIHPGELLTHFSFIAPPEGVQSVFIKLGRRNAQAISRLSMAVLGRVNASGIIDFIRLTPGAATPKTVRFTQVEDLLLGQQSTEKLLAFAAEKTAEAMIAITGRRWSTDYKEIAIRALAERALRHVLLAGSANGKGN